MKKKLRNDIVFIIALPVIVGLFSLVMQWLMNWIHG